MILITSTLVIFMASVGLGNPLPEPYPEPNLIIQVRQVVHRLNCKKPHDAEGPFGHPTTEATGDNEDLEKQKEEIEADIIKAETELNETKEAVETLENEVAEQQAGADAINDILDEFDDFEFRRKRSASVYENVRDVLGGLGDLLEQSHRRRRASGSDTQFTITYCQGGVNTDTGFNLWSQLLTDLGEALAKTPRDIPELICLKKDMKTLKALGIQLTAEEKQELKTKKNEAKAKAQAAKEEAETALAEKKAALETKKAEQEVLAQNLKEKNEEKEKIDAQIAGITLAPETTDLPDTTIETTLITKEVTTAAVEIPPTTEPTN